jgi:hypothetical protein
VEKTAGVVASLGAWRLLLARGDRCAGAVWSARQPPAKTEAPMVGQLALVTSEETVAPAAAWETLPPERRRQVTLRLAGLLARPVVEEGAR